MTSPLDSTRTACWVYGPVDWDGERHVCTLPAGHDGRHVCCCGAGWEGDDGA